MASFPPPPVATIDWSTLGFNVTEVHGHIESSYSVKTGLWSPPKLIKDPYLRVHGMSPALNYGLQAFEGMKAYRTPSNKIAIFRPIMNAERLIRSATCLGMPILPLEHFLKCVYLAVGANAAFVGPHESGAALYIRPLIIGINAQLTLTPPEEYLFCVYVSPTGTYHGVRPLDALILEDFDRAAPNGTGAVKIGGNYAPVFRFSAEAKLQGFGITLHLDSKTQTEIDEFSTSAFLGIKLADDGETFTVVVPNSKSVLESVTSASVCDIAASFGARIERRPIPYKELSSFTEVTAVGTAATLVPIKSITMRSNQDKFVYHDGNDEPGPVVKMLSGILKGIQRGTHEDSFGWITYVEEPKELL